MGKDFEPEVAGLPSPTLNVDVEQKQPLNGGKGTGRGSSLGSVTAKDAFNCVRFIVTGGGFMIDQYNLFILGTVMTCMKQCDYIGKYSKTQNKIVKMLILLGAVAGQLTFGTVGDVIGRRPAFLMTLSFVISGSILSASIPGLEHTSGKAAYWWLGIFQFLLGFGVGGEYPLSASVSRESSPDFRKIGYTFCMQGVGFVLGPIVFLILLAAADGSGSYDLSWVWRGALAFSAIPGVLLIYPRWQMQGLHSRKVDKSGKKQDLEPFFAVICKKDEDGNRTNLRRFLGTTLSWFLFDVSFYGNSIMATTVFDNLGISDGSGSGDAPWDAAPASYHGHEWHSHHHKVMSASIHMLIVACLGLPGYFMSVVTVKKMGLYRIQLFGFTMMAVLFGIIAASYHSIKDNAAVFLILYGLTFFFTNWGPNYTTFINPTMLFETSIRARAHGMSAAAGKVGGALGVFVLAEMLDDIGDDASPTGFQSVAMLCTAIALLGVLVTVLCFPRDIEAEGRRIFKKPIDWAGDDESEPPSPASTMH